MEDLYKKDTYENKNILYLFNKEINEYDISSAGLNIAKDFNLLPEDTIKYLEGFSKDKRVVKEGNLQRSNTVFREGLKEGLRECRKWFIESNKLERDDIISIRKDAIWTCKRCKHLKFTTNVKFKQKNEFTSFLRIGKRIQCYYHPMKKIRVSGIGDTNVSLHEDFMLSFIYRWFNKMETSNPKEVIEFTRRFIDKYKSLELPVGFYRTFDNTSKIVTKDGITLDDYWEDQKENIDISYNYFNVLLKMIKVPL